MRDYHHFLFFASKVQNGAATLDQDESRHAIKVLRLKTGELFQAASGNGKIFECKLDTVEHDCIKATILNESNITPVPVKIHCYIGIPDRDCFETIITDLTAMGISSITPLISDFCQKDWWESKWEKHLLRFQSKMISAMKQSLYPFIPRLNNPVQLMDVEADSLQSILVADPQGQPLPKVCSLIKSDIGCIIGPPGGFSDNEINLFKAKQYQLVTIAGTRLRTELATVVLCGQILGESL